MLKKIPPPDSSSPQIKEFINLQNPFIILAEKIPWGKIENELSVFYSHTGAPAKSIRTMVGLSILKHLYDLSDRDLVKQWLMNPYFQHFCGEIYFRWEVPCHHSEMTYFRKRIGKEGVEKLLAFSVQMHGEQIIKSKTILVDTTVQEKNITFPTDSKLHIKIINRCKKISQKVGVKLRQSYHRIVKKLIKIQSRAHQIKWAKAVKKARKQIKTIAGRLVRDVVRKVTKLGKLSTYEPEIALFNQVLAQTKKTKDKIYSLHERAVACIAKGKAAKKYEFGSKVSLAILPKSNIVVGVCNFLGNPHDSKTLHNTLSQVKKITGRDYEQAVVDRGYRGCTKIEKTKIIIPDNNTRKSCYEKAKKRKLCRSRAAIEPIIGHLKHDHRMLRNYLKGTVGDSVNALLSGMAFNFKLVLRKIEQSGQPALLGV